MFLFSGESGEAYGYRDRWIGERYHYTGAGQIGDMQMVRGNQAIEGHAIRRKSLLLFTDIGKGRCRFEAEMIFERRYPEKEDVPDVDSGIYKKPNLVLEVKCPKTTEKWFRKITLGNMDQHLLQSVPCVLCDKYHTFRGAKFPPPKH